MSKMFRIILLICSAVLVVNGCGDYYWREYHGVVPKDAIPAGKDADGKVRYIGHAYMHEYGIMQGAIVAGVEELQVSCYGPKNANHMIEILCASDHSKFYWLPVTTGQYKKQTEGLCPILSGWDQKGAEDLKKSKIELFTGRTFEFNNYYVGDIAVQPDDPNCYFHTIQDNADQQRTSYEVLIYNEFPVDLDHLPQGAKLVYPH